MAGRPQVARGFWVGVTCSSIPVEQAEGCVILFLSLLLVSRTAKSAHQPISQAPPSPISSIRGMCQGPGIYLNEANIKHGKQRCMAIPEAKPANGKLQERSNPSQRVP